MLVAARDAGAARLFYSSSACVYRADKQGDADTTPLKEEDAYPVMPEDGMDGKNSSPSEWPDIS
jgi:nucleoside-diphosphate-sugar epimerase